LVASAALIRQARFSDAGNWNTSDLRGNWWRTATRRICFKRSSSTVRASSYCQFPELFSEDAFYDTTGDVVEACRRRQQAVRPGSLSRALIGSPVVHSQCLDDRSVILLADAASSPSWGDALTGPLPEVISV